MLNRHISLRSKRHTKTLHFLLICSGLILALTMFSAKPIRSMPATPGKGLSSDSAAAVATWSSLPNMGLNQRVRALAVTADELYVGGRFTETGDGALADLGGVARYDIAAGSWNALPNQGLANEGAVLAEVIALAVTGNDLFVGGSFSQTGDGITLNLGNIARFDMMAGNWNALPKQGLNGEVFALAVIGDYVYVGGSFNETNDGSLTDLGGIVRYDTSTGTWGALPNQGLYGGVYTLATAGSNLYVGGNFTQTNDGTVLDLNRIARFDTVAGTWNALPNQGLDGNVTALTVSGSDLYAAGYFAETGDGTMLNLGNIIHFDITAGVWNALSNQGLNDQVDALAVVDTDLYVGGTFQQTGDGAVTNLGYIGRYDSVIGSWNGLSNQGLNGWIHVMTTVDNHVYVGGNFSQTGDGAIGLNRIARLASYEQVLYMPLVIR